MKELEFIFEQAKEELSESSFIKFTADYIYQLQLINSYIKRKKYLLKKLFDKYKEQ